MTSGATWLQVPLTATRQLTIASSLVVGVTARQGVEALGQVTRPGPPVSAVQTGVAASWCRMSVHTDAVMVTRASEVATRGAVLGTWATVPVAMLKVAWTWRGGSAPPQRVGSEGSPFLEKCPQ